MVWQQEARPNNNNNKTHARRRLRLRRRRKNLYSPPIEDDDATCASCNLGSGIIKRATLAACSCTGGDDPADTIMSRTCCSPQELISAASAQQFEKALFAGVDEVTRDLQDLWQIAARPDDDNRDTSASSEDNAVCCGIIAPTTATTQLLTEVDDNVDEHNCLELLCSDCEKWEGFEDDNSYDGTDIAGGGGVFDTTNDDSFHTRGTLQSTACTVETTEIETFLDSRWTPMSLDHTTTGKRNDAAPLDEDVPISRKTILLQRQVFHHHPTAASIQKYHHHPLPSILTVPDRRRGASTAHRHTDAPTTTTAGVLPSSPPQTKCWGSCTAAARRTHDASVVAPPPSSPTSVVMLLDDTAAPKEEQPPPRCTTSHPHSSTARAGSAVSNNSSSSTTSTTSGAGTAVHSNARAHAIIAQADALVRAMVQPPSSRRRRPSSTRWRHLMGKQQHPMMAEI